MLRFHSGRAQTGAASASGSFSPGASGFPHSISGLLRGVSLGLATLGGLALDARAVPITPGNLVVVRVGDGSAALSSASTAVFLDEYTQAGVFVQSIPLPTAVAGANNPFTNSGTATSEGFLNVSANGQYLVHAGYAAAPGVAGIAATASSSAARVVARVDLAGNIDTTTAFTGDTSYSMGNIRSATSNDGTQFWTAGTASGTTGPADSGVRYVASLGATTSSQVSATVTNTRVVEIYAGQLYVTTSSGSYKGVNTVGTGLDQGPAATTTLLVGFPSAIPAPSSYDFFFADASTLYVADDSTAGGIEKWTESGGTWTHVYTLSTATSPVGCRGLSGVVNGGVTTLFATTTQTANNIVTVTDTGIGSVVTVLVPAPSFTAFRGVRLIGNVVPPGASFCPGDGTGTNCPCTNNSPVGNNEGCLNSLGTGGKLVSSGTPSLSGDTVVLTGSQMPNSSALYFQGSAPQNGGSGSIFGDGLRCAAGSIFRLGTKTNVAGTSQYPSGTDLSVSVKGFVTTPSVRYYQCWYRNAALFCVATSTFNLTNGWILTWVP